MVRLCFGGGGGGGEGKKICKYISLLNLFKLQLNFTRESWKVLSADLRERNPIS